MPEQSYANHTRKTPLFGVFLMLLMLAFVAGCFTLYFTHGDHGQFHNALVMQSGAYQNGTWVVGVAKAGVEEGVDSLGQSLIIAPSGQIVAQAVTTGDELLVARCDLDWCARYSGTLFDFDKYRRPEVYTRITAQRGVVLPEVES